MEVGKGIWRGRKGGRGRGREKSLKCFYVYMSRYKAEGERGGRRGRRGSRESRERREMGRKKRREGEEGRKV